MKVYKHQRGCISHLQSSLKKKKKNRTSQHGSISIVQKKKTHNRIPLHSFTSTEYWTGHERQLLQMQQLQRSRAGSAQAFQQRHAMVISTTSESSTVPDVDHLADGGLSPPHGLCICAPASPRAFSSKLLSRVKQVEGIQQPCWPHLQGLSALAWQATRSQEVGVDAKCA